MLSAQNGNLILIKRSRKGNFLKEKKSACATSKKSAFCADFFVCSNQLSDRSKNLNIIQSFIRALIACAAFHNRGFSSSVKTAHLD